VTSNAPALAAEQEGRVSASRSAIGSDPLRTVIDALERHGCEPRGPEYRCTARCPAHEDRDPSLSVAEGVDGRALVYCHAGCPPERVVAALGLSWSDLFPPGHRSARRLPGVGAPRKPIELVFEVLAERGIPRRATRSPQMWVAERCPACCADRKWPLWLLEQDDGRVVLSCFAGCPQVAVLSALVGAEGGDT
jgi:hypothetical protein